MSGPARTAAVAVRVFRQVRRDRRTLGLMFGVPVVLLAIVTHLLEGPSSPPRVAVVGPTPRLSAWFASNVLEPAAAGAWTVVDAGSADPEALVREGRANAAVAVPPDLFTAVARGMLPRLELVVEGADYQLTARLVGDFRRMLPGMMAKLGVAVAGPLAMLMGGRAATGAAVGPGELPLAVRYVYGHESMRLVDYVAPALLAFLTFFFVYLLTSTAFLRERQRGTLAWLATTPLRAAEVVAGYMAALSPFVLAQAAVVTGFVVGVLGVRYRGSLGWVVLVELLLTVAAASLGIFLSAFARNELQVVQFIPVVIIPQAVLSGLVVSVRLLPPLLKPVAYAMPLTYATAALTDVMVRGLGIAALWDELLVLAGFALLFGLLGLRVVRRA